MDDRNWRGVSFRDVVRALVGEVVRRGAGAPQITYGRRTAAIAACLAGSRWTLQVSGNFGKIWRHASLDPERPVVVVLTHVFADSPGGATDCAGETWRGPVDRLVANAVVAALMLRDELDPQVVVSFVCDEMGSAGGTGDTVETLMREWGLDVRFALVADLMPERRGEDCSVVLASPYREDSDFHEEIVGMLLPVCREADPGAPALADQPIERIERYVEAELACGALLLPCAVEGSRNGRVAVRAARVEPYAAALAGCARAALAFDDFVFDPYAEDREILVGAVALNQLGFRVGFWW